MASSFKKITANKTIDGIQGTYALAIIEIDG